MAAPALSIPTLSTTRIEAGRLPVFDILRAVAALLVFFYHYAGLVAPFTEGAPLLDAAEWIAARIGAIGTNLLLLLSGYFLAQNLATGRFPYLHFVWLRVVRIYVPYLTVLALAILFASLAPAYTRVQPNALNWRHILEQTLLLPGLFPERPFLTVTWTLSYIVAGYITLPLFGIALRRFDCRAPTRLAVWALLVMGNLIAGLTLGAPPLRFAYIPAGYLLFELQCAEWLPHHRPGILRWATGICLVALLYRALLDGHLIGNHWLGFIAQLSFIVTGLIAVTTIVFATIVLQSRYPAQGQRPLPRRIAAFGRTGYSFYLVHGPVVKLFSLLIFPQIARHALPAATLWLAAPLCLACAAGAATLLYFAVEKPCRRFLLGH